VLTFKITDLAGEELTTLLDHQGGEVVITQNDARTAKVTLSAYDARVGFIQPLSRMLKVYFWGELVFWGVILTPIWTSQDSNPTVEINAHDQSIWWKKNYHRYGDYAVDVGYTINGKGMQTLAESAIPLPSQEARGVPGPGIYWGYDDSVDWRWADAVGGGLVAEQGFGPYPADPSAPVAGEGVWGKIERGTNVFESITGMGTSAVGPDWELRPVDAEHPPTTNVGGVRTLNPNGYETGYYAQLDTYEHQGEDKSGTVVFHRNFGLDNLASLVWTPDGDKVINYSVAVAPGGETDRADVRHRALSHNEASWLSIGIYESWQSAGQDDPKAVLQTKADADVEAYHLPPDFLTLGLLPDDGSGVAWRYLRDFEMGDEVGVAGMIGVKLVQATARITKITLIQPSDSAATTTSLDVVPDVGGTDTSGDEGG
jgi:hypothetical protein